MTYRVMPRMVAAIVVTASVVALPARGTVLGSAPGSSPVVVNNSIGAAHLGPPTASAQVAVLGSGATTGKH